VHAIEMKKDDKKDSAGAEGTSRVDDVGSVDKWND
jgi:hypothetical protein